MYNYLYIVFYKLSERAKMSDPNDYATTIVTLGIASHIFLLLSAINYFTGENLLVMAFGSNKNKIFLLLPIFIMIFLVNRIYKKNGINVVDRYKGRNIIKPANVFLCACIIVIPFLGTIYFLNNW
jgi:hypothetical protein